MDWFSNLAPHWFWLTLGALLGAAEIVAPGFFLIWLALAAIVTGLAAWVLPIGFAVQIGLFAVLSVVAVYAARNWLKQNPIVSDDPLLNDRGARLVGELVTVVEAIDGGQGRVKVGDSVWSARGPDTPEGSRVRVTGSSGSTLTVEAV
jgi:membrane protein implicated in regulation of membrane protease activity